MRSQAILRKKVAAKIEFPVGERRGLRRRVEKRDFEILVDAVGKNRRSGLQKDLVVTEKLQESKMKTNEFVNGVSKELLRAMTPVAATLGILIGMGEGWKWGAIFGTMAVIAAAAFVLLDDPPIREIICNIEPIDDEI